MGEYLGSQIFEKKLEYDRVVEAFPQWKDKIDEYLKNKESV